MLTNNTPGDGTFDQSYEFGKPLSYLSERQQARMLILRGEIQDGGYRYDNERLLAEGGYQDAA